MNYTELQTALADWSARSDLTSYLPSFIEFSTAMFNQGQGGVSPLRLREMMAITSLVPTSGVCTLPTDYLQYRRVVELASRRRDLQYVTPTYADQEYSDRASGLSSDFTIIGSSLYMFPLSSNNIELTYYQAIPNLSDAAPTNWLLTKQPNLYLHAGLMQLAMFTKDNDLFSRSAALVTAFIDGLNSSDTLANLAKAGTRIQGVTP
ncbi:hypothetical protein CN204_04220 [Sinorhizobium meliloti]|uniref:phage adaptor protein n=1 Tax=Rhizobium meliloti TaxID=382 RepID=UPI000FDA29BB|nr:hypothetical protein [Sinorhizobium meliloti]RVH87743.1 hypothetical protein CN204_04220 [Sinorhizobium meliloti]